ncbi:MAG: cytidylate kinase family protein [Oscillospiraceae bacterium]|nr:cytidylate kinase family protein [Oscillospiraceae bacterium]
MAGKISITGDLGSGKSTVCGILERDHGFGVYKVGAIQREIAGRRGMTTLELNEYAETHPEIDREIDDALRRKGEEPGRMVFDSRMAWHFVPSSLKVYLRVGVEEAVRRIMGDDRGTAESYAEAEEARAKIEGRKVSENKRYSEKYGVDCGDMGNFDLVIDTTAIGPDEVARLIMEGLAESGRG